MSDYDNNMSGALFKNKKKASDRHPDYTGNCEINKEEMWVSAWLKTSKSGETFMSLAFTPKEQPASKSTSNVVPMGNVDEMEDIPF